MIEDGLTGFEGSIWLQPGFLHPSPRAKTAANGRAAVSEPHVGLDPTGDSLRIAGMSSLSKPPFELNVVFFFEPLRLGPLEVARDFQTAVHPNAARTSFGTSRRYHQTLPRRCRCDPDRTRAVFVAILAAFP